MKQQQADFDVRDFDGNIVAIGTRVQMWDYGVDHPDWGQHDRYRGVVIGFTDWDIDDSGEDSYGRVVVREVGPEVKVRWDNGEEDKWPTSEWSYEGFSEYDEWLVAHGKVEELSVIKAETS